MLAVLLFSQTAAAGPMINAEGVTAFATLGDSAVDLGSGIGLRAGWPIDVLALELVPELGLTVWSNDQLAVVPEAGARLSIGKVLEPGIYGHVQWLSTTEQPGWDAGLSLDLTAIPKIDLGIQAGVFAFGAAPTATAGVHLGVKL